LEDKLSELLDDLQNKNEASNNENLNLIQLVISIKTKISQKKEFIEKKRLNLLGNFLFLLCVYLNKTKKEIFFLIN
jgi:hypothetical protein